MENIKDVLNVTKIKSKTLLFLQVIENFEKYSAQSVITLNMLKYMNLVIQWIAIYKKTTL